MADEHSSGTAFTSEDFEAARAWIEEAHLVSGHGRALEAALRIAANVMRPGFMEEELYGYLDYSDHESLAGRVRDALIGKRLPGDM